MEILILRSLPEAIVNMIHEHPEQCIISGIVILVLVWTIGIIKIIRNNHKTPKDKKKNKT